MKKENILIVNIHSSKNVGDAALLQVAIKQVKENFPNCSITLSMDDPDSHTGDETKINSIISWVYRFGDSGRTGWHYFRLIQLLPATLFPIICQKIFHRRIWLLSPLSIRNLINSYLEADLIISKPGGYVYSTGRGISFLLIIYTLMIAHWAGKPIYLFPQSIGPLNYKWEEYILRWLLNHVRVVMTREPISYDYVRKLGIRNTRCYLLPDSAFAMPSAGHEVGVSWLAQYGIDLQSGNPLLGMTVFDWGAHDSRFKDQLAYETAVAGAIRYFIETYHGQVILFPQAWGPVAGEDDRVTANRIASRIPNVVDHVILVNEPITAEILKSIYGCMDIFIGTRMHSNIFAVCEDVPIIAIGYQHKTKGITFMLGIDKWVLDINHIQAEDLINKMKNLWEERYIWRSKIHELIPHLVSEAGRAGKIIADDYQEFQKKDLRGEANS